MYLFIWIYRIFLLKGLNCDMIIYYFNFKQKCIFQLMFVLQVQRIHAGMELPVSRQRMKTLVTLANADQVAVEKIVMCVVVNQVVPLVV